MRSMFQEQKTGAIREVSDLGRLVTSVAGRALLSGLVFLQGQLRSASYEKRHTAYVILKQSDARGFSHLGSREREVLTEVLGRLKERYISKDYENGLNAAKNLMEKLLGVPAQIEALKQKALKGDDAAKKTLLGGHSYYSSELPTLGEQGTQALFSAQKSVLEHELKKVVERKNASARDRLAAISRLGFSDGAFKLIRKHTAEIMGSDSNEAFRAHLASLEDQFKAKRAEHRREQKQRQEGIAELEEYAGFRREIKEMLGTSMKEASEATLNQLQIELMKAKKNSQQAQQIEGMVKAITEQLTKERAAYDELGSKTILEAKGNLLRVEHELLLQRMMKIIEDEQATPLYRIPLRDLFAEAPDHLAAAIAESDAAQEAFDALSAAYRAGLERVVG